MEAEMDDTWADVDDNDTSRNVSNNIQMNIWFLLSFTGFNRLHFFRMANR